MHLSEIGADLQFQSVYVCIQHRRRDGTMVLNTSATLGNGRGSASKSENVFYLEF